MNLRGPPASARWARARAVSIHEDGGGVAGGMEPGAAIPLAGLVALLSGWLERAPGMTLLRGAPAAGRAP